MPFGRTPKTKAIFESQLDATQNSSFSIHDWRQLKASTVRYPVAKTNPPMNAEPPRLSGNRPYTELKFSAYLLEKFHLLPPGQPATLPSLHPRSPNQCRPSGPKSIAALGQTRMPESSVPQVRILQNKSRSGTVICPLLPFQYCALAVPN